jgi:hypothetical protein
MKRSTVRQVVGQSQHYQPTGRTIQSFLVRPAVSASQNAPKKSSTGSDFRTSDASRVPLPKCLVAISINQVVEQGALVRRKKFAGTLAFAKGMNI